MKSLLFCTFLNLSNFNFTHIKALAMLLLYKLYTFVQIVFSLLKFFFLSALFFAHWHKGLSLKHYSGSKHNLQRVTFRWLLQLNRDQSDCPCLIYLIAVRIPNCLALSILIKQNWCSIGNQNRFSTYDYQPFFFEVQLDAECLNQCEPHSGMLWLQRKITAQIYAPRTTFCDW